MQLVRCIECGQPLCRIDPASKQVYEVGAGRDDKPFQRVDKHGNPAKKGKPQTPTFHLNDKRTVNGNVKDEKSGLETETTTEEPMTITCLCGRVNIIN